ncbi:MAG TPA: cytochrome C oxidase subunit IV family protein [Pirellulales bacterium]|nr:cytochrome C oxidase subunit IV family protein [Pirellulales bacterium]
MTESHPQVTHQHVTVRQYFGVFIALMVLLALTVLLAMRHLGKFNTPVAMAVATLKTVLVVTYFMHLRYSSRLVWLFAASGMAFMVILFAGTFNDYDSRDWFTGRLGSVPETADSIDRSHVSEWRSDSIRAPELRREASERPSDGRTKD